jgi:hypothetical protein
MNTEKADFIKKKFIPLLQQLQTDTKGKWGLMNAQQMVEHFSWLTRMASGKTVMERVTPEEHLPRLREFILSEKLFKENTKNPLMTDEPSALRNASMKAAIDELQEELNYFFQVFEANPQLITSNPFFGDLDYAQNIHLMHKHVMHHLKQFDLV